MLRVVLLSIAFIAGVGPLGADEPWIGQGTVIASKFASLRVSSPRIVAKVARDIGSPVKKGDILVQCDDKMAKAALNITRLGVKKAELEVRNAEAKVVVAKASSQLRRTELEATPPKATKAQVDLADADVEAAFVQVDLAKTDLELARELLANEELKMQDLVLRAPFDGLVSGRYAEPGDLAPAGNSVVDLIGGPLIIQASVPDRLVRFIGVKYPVDVYLLKEFGGETFKGEISRMATIINTKDRTFTIEVTLPEAAQNSLRPGMIVNMKIVGKDKEKEKD